VARTFYNKEAEVFVVAFKGSVSGQDFYDDILRGASVPMSRITFPEDIPGTLHTGFVEHYMTAASQVEQDVLKNLLNLYSDGKLASKQFQIVVTGHSLGGALAQLFALRLAHLLKTRYGPIGNLVTVKTVTFAAPAVGCEVAKAYFETLVPNAVSYINGDDIVPLISQGVDKESWSSKIAFTRVLFGNVLDLNPPPQEPAQEVEQQKLESQKSWYNPAKYYDAGKRLAIGAISTIQDTINNTKSKVEWLKLAVERHRMKNYYHQIVDRQGKIPNDADETAPNVLNFDEENEEDWEDDLFEELF